MELKISEIAAKVGGVVDGDGEAIIRGIAALDESIAGDLSFLANPKYAKLVAECEASAILVANDWQGEHKATLIRVENPDRAFAQIAPMYAVPPVVFPKNFVHPTAVLGEGVKLGADVYVGPYAVLGDGCVVGDRCVIEAHVVLGEHCTLGDDTHLFPSVTLRERVKVGERVRIHNGTVLGSDGYGYSVSMDSNGLPQIVKVPQVGTVEIADDVEIGANTTIDRARFGATRIGRCVKIDNLVQIGHNVQVADFTGIVAQVGIAGSARIGSGVMLWGQSGIAGHIKVGDGVQVMAQAGVSSSVPDGETVLGSPAMGKREFLRAQHNARLIPKLMDRIAKLEAKIDELTQRLEEKK